MFKINIFLATLLLAASLIAFFVYQAYDLNGDLSRNDYGTIGDYFGGILNPIFAFLSFIALLSTIWLQIRELEAQRKELRLTRKEMKYSKKAQQDSAIELKLQNQLQYHAVRVNGLRTLIDATAIEARNGSDENRLDAIREMEVHTRQLNAELEAVSELLPEGKARIRDAEINLFGFSDQE